MVTSSLDALPVAARKKAELATEAPGAESSLVVEVTLKLSTLGRCVLASSHTSYLGEIGTLVHLRGSGISFSG
jgi:hypothetical protein